MILQVLSMYESATEREEQIKNMSAVFEELIHLEKTSGLDSENLTETIRNDHPSIELIRVFACQGESEGGGGCLLADPVVNGDFAAGLTSLNCFPDGDLGWTVLGVGVNVVIQEINVRSVWYGHPRHSQRILAPTFL